MASPMEPKPASADRGPVWPKPDTWTTISPGLERRRTLVAQTPLVQPTGPEVLEYHVDPVGQAPHQVPAGPARRSMATDRLLRAMAGHQRP